MKFWVFLFLIPFLYSCGGKFVPDPIVPDLPTYTSKGYNAAGAIVNGSIWRAVSRCGGFSGCSNTMRFSQHSDKLATEISFDGEILNSNLLDVESYYFSIFLYDTQLLALEDLETLRGKKFDLGNIHHAEVYDYDNDTLCISTEGQIFFDKIILDGNGYIVSGTFGFVVDGDGCNRIEVFSGRFDYIINSI